MWWALIRKELREIAPYAAAGGGLYLILLVEMLSFIPRHESPFEFVASLRWFEFLSWGRNPSVPPFVDDSLNSILLFLSILLTTAFGLRQTLGEEGRRTFPILLHFPFGKNRVLISKVAVGAGVYLMMTFSLISILAIDCSIPGHYAYPFEWGMILDSVTIPFRGVLLYLAAFLVGLHTANWYATRTLPGILALAVAIFPFFPIWLSIAFIVPIILITLCLVAICHESRIRDYR